MRKKITKNSLTKRVGESVRVLTPFQDQVKWYNGRLIETCKYPKAYAIQCERDLVVPLIKGETRIGVFIKYPDYMRRKIRKEGYIAYYDY